MSLLYLAYGANMDPAAMAMRCPGAVALGVCRLAGWRFAIRRHGYATLEPAPGGEAHGVLWRLTPAHRARLDAFENVSGGMYRRSTIPVLHAGRRIRALLYVSVMAEPGVPAFGYLERMVLPGARHFGLPARYIEELARWAMPKRRKLNAPRAF